MARSRVAIFVATAAVVLQFWAFAQVWKMERALVAARAMAANTT